MKILLISRSERIFEEIDSLYKDNVIFYEAFSKAKKNIEEIRPSIIMLGMENESFVEEFNIYKNKMPVVLISEDQVKKKYKVRTFCISQIEEIKGFVDSFFAEKQEFISKNEELKMEILFLIKERGDLKEMGDLDVSADKIRVSFFHPSKNLIVNGKVVKIYEDKLVFSFEKTLKDEDLGEYFISKNSTLYFNMEEDGVEEMKFISAVCKISSDFYCIYFLKEDERKAFLSNFKGLIKKEVALSKDSREFSANSNTNNNSLDSVNNFDNHL